MSRLVLVVEDNALNSELLCDWLGSRGYEAVCVENLESAYAALKSQVPDMVLLDVQLGVEDGLGLAVWMHQQPRLCRVPVIAVTAHAMVTEQERFLQAGCNACVAKPVDFRELSREMDRWLGATRAVHYSIDSSHL